MKTLNIDFNYLIFAYQDSSPDNIYYLNTEYGDIRLVHRNLHDLRDLTDEIELSPNSFLYIPKASKEDLLNDLRDFYDLLDDLHMKKMLTVAFDSPHVLEAFKKILAKDSALSQEFETYLYERTKKCLLRWLAANAISLDNPSLEQ